MFNRSKAQYALLQLRQVLVSPSRDLCRVKDLSKHTFWKKKYSFKNSTSGEAFDWFLESHKIYPHIESHIEQISRQTSADILAYAELGCGTSGLPLVTYKQSPLALKIILTDYVLEALRHQASLFHGQEAKHPLSSFHLVCVDVLRLPLRDDSLQLVIDKGTMDSLLKDRNRGTVNAKLMTSEVMRVLSSRGRYVHVTDEDPDSRLLLLESFCDAYNNNENEQYSDCHTSHLSDNVDSSNQRGKESEIRDSIDEVDSKNWSSSNWSFKVISDNKTTVEYFMYWIDKP